MPNIRFNTQITNDTPLPAGDYQRWVSLGLQPDEVVFITAVAATLDNPTQADTLRVEDLSIETAGSAAPVPGRKIHFKVRNTSTYPIAHYVVNVGFLSP